MASLALSSRPQAQHRQRVAGLGPQLQGRPAARPTPASAIRRCQLRRGQSTAVRASEPSAAAGTSQDQQPEQKSVELPTADVKTSVRLSRLRAGDGYAIVVAAVEPGSQAAAAGVRPGQRLLQLSDPIRSGGELWQLNESSSLRYINQAVRLRVATSITLVLTAQPILEWQQALAAARAEAAPLAQQQQDAAAEPEGEAGPEAGPEPESDLLSNIAQAISSGESFDEAADAAEGGDAPTVAERLERQYQQQQGEGEGGSAAPPQGMTALEKRQARRKAYFEQDSQRNDAPFFSAVAALFVLPPLGILLWAWLSGYLDTLDMYGQLR